MRKNLRALCPFRELNKINMKNISKHIISGVIMMVLIMPLFVFAGVTTGPNLPADTTTNNPDATTKTAPIKIDIKINNPFKQNTIEGLINTIIKDILIPIGAVVAVLMIMYAGYLYVTARGDSKQIGDAHEALKWAVIGAAILLGARIISEAIGRTIEQLR